MQFSSIIIYSKWKKEDVNMLVKNTPENRELQKVCATMAIEEMYPSEELVNKLMDIDNGKLTIEELIQELVKKYAR